MKQYITSEAELKPWKVFVKTGRITLRCAVYWIFILVLASSFLISYRTAASDMERYGIGGETSAEAMRAITYRLFRETSVNEYDTYLFGFLPVHKQLDAEERQKAFELFEKITGKTIYEVDAEYCRMDLAKVMETSDLTEFQAKEYLRSYYRELEDEFSPGSEVTRFYEYEDYMPLREDLTDEAFRNLMAEVRELIGRKTAAYEDGTSGGPFPLDAKSPWVGNNVLLIALLSVLIAAEAALGGTLRRRSGTLRQEEALDLSGQGLIQNGIVCLTISSLIMIPLLIFAMAAADTGSSGEGSALAGYFLSRILPAVLLSSAAGLVIGARISGKKLF